MQCSPMVLVYSHECMAKKNVPLASLPQARCSQSVPMKESKDLGC